MRKRVYDFTSLLHTKKQCAEYYIPISVNVSNLNFQFFYETPFSSTQITGAFIYQSVTIAWHLKSGHWPRWRQGRVCPLRRRWLHASTQFLCAIAANGRSEPFVTSLFELKSNFIHDFAYDRLEVPRVGKPRKPQTIFDAVDH